MTPDLAAALPAGGVVSIAPLKAGNFGASHDDGEHVHAGATRADAIAGAVEDWLGQVDVGDIDEPAYPHQLALQLYTGLEWCVGPTGEHEDCYCGLRHLDYGDGKSEPMMLVNWASRDDITHEVNDG